MSREERLINKLTLVLSKAGVTHTVKMSDEPELEDSVVELDSAFHVQICSYDDEAYFFSKWDEIAGTLTHLGSFHENNLDQLVSKIAEVKR